MNRWEQTVRKVLTWTLIAGLVLGFVFLLTYRYCEQVGPEAKKSCLTAGFIAAAGGVGAFWPLGTVWGKQKPEKLVTGILLGEVIRLLIGFAGVVIIVFFTHINRGWFLGCYGIFYMAVLLADSWMVVRLFHHCSMTEDECKYE
jgi:hypothetical protein